MARLIQRQGMEATGGYLFEGIVGVLGPADHARGRPHVFDDAAHPVGQDAVGGQVPGTGRLWGGIRRHGIGAVRRDRDRNMPIGGGSVAQLTGIVVSPCPEVAGRIQRQGMLVSGGYRGVPALGSDRQRGMPFSSGAVAQLTGPVAAPCP